MTAQQRRQEQLDATVRVVLVYGTSKYSFSVTLQLVDQSYCFHCFCAAHAVFHTPCFTCRVSGGDRPPAQCTVYHQASAFRFLHKPMRHLIAAEKGLRDYGTLVSC